MKYPKEYLDEIKLRIKVSQVVGRTVKLKKRGKEFIGLSPFSSEKTPSFTVNDDKGFYHCFSSGEHGNIFDFLIKIKNFKFGEAVRALASEAGMPAYRFTKQDEERDNRWKIYNNILEKYVDFFNQKLSSNKNLEAYKYLENRKLTTEEIKLFKIGYVPHDNDFYQILKKEFTNEQLKSSGIYYFDEQKGKYIDRFKGRIIFPVKNLNGMIIALGGRSISKNYFAKYINSPETEFYKKGNNLFNLNNARNSKEKEEQVFIVEGYMDVISLSKFKIENVVANLGTAMTEKQIELIWRFFKKPIICLDGDSSGQRAALRIAERLFPLIKPEYQIYFLTLPTNQDPDNFVNSEGRESFLNYSQNKVDIQNFIWDSYFRDVNKSKPESLALFEKKMKELCYQINDKILSKYYLDNFTQKLAELTPALNIKKQNYYTFKKRNSPLNQTKITVKEKFKFSEQVLKEYSILYIIINNLDLFHNKIEEISELNFSSDILNKFKNKIIDCLSSNETKLSNFNLSPEFSKIVNEINLVAPVKVIVENKNEEDLYDIFCEIMNEIKKIGLNNKIRVLENKVAKDMDESLYNELISLKNQLKRG